MRFVLAMVLAGLVALPLSVSAQVGEEGQTSETNLQESAASSEPAHEQGALSPGLRKRTRKKWDPQTYDVPASRPSPEEPALQLKLDDAVVGVVAPPSRTPDGYTLEEMELRVKRAKIGLGVSVGVVGAGLMLATVGGLVSWANTPLGGEETEAPAAWGAMVAGLTMMAAGAAAMITSGVVYGVRKRQLRKHKRELWGSPYTHYGTPRRVQWDLERSRLVF